MDYGRLTTFARMRHPIQLPHHGRKVADSMRADLIRSFKTAEGRLRFYASKIMRTSRLSPTFHGTLNEF